MIISGIDIRGVSLGAYRVVSYLRYVPTTSHICTVNGEFWETVPLRSLRSSTSAEVALNRLDLGGNALNGGSSVDARNPAVNTLVFFFFFGIYYI